MVSLPKAELSMVSNPRPASSLLPHQSPNRGLLFCRLLEATAPSTSVLVWLTPGPLGPVMPRGRTSPLGLRSNHSKIQLSPCAKPATLDPHPHPSHRRVLKIDTSVSSERVSRGFPSLSDERRRPFFLKSVPESPLTADYFPACLHQSAGATSFLHTLRIRFLADKPQTWQRVCFSAGLFKGFLTGRKEHKSQESRPRASPWELAHSGN